MKKTLIISNWKLHGNKKLVNNAIDFLKKNCIHVSGKYQIIIAPPLVYLDTARNQLLNNNCIKLCAQNVDINLSGAFTGDISALMLQDLGVQYALVGHSERRIHHKEQDLDIIKKISILKKTGLIPILCIGEHKKEQDSTITSKICINQIDFVIKALGIQSLQNTIIAYEPIWAIGTGISMPPEEAQLTHKNIRNHIAQYDSKIADKILIQYGGSVNKNNIIKFLSQKDIDGVLIGSASLDIKNFYEIIKLIEIHINT